MKEICIKACKEKKRKKKEGDRGRDEIAKRKEVPRETHVRTENRIKLRNRDVQQRNAAIDCR